MTIFDALDAKLGDAVDSLVARHHRARLRRNGWPVDFGGSERSWASGGAGPRDGNAARIHIDGESALSAITRAIRAATSDVLIAGWHLSPSFRVARGDDGEESLRELLAQVAERVPVRVLMWAGPPLPVFKPTRAMARRSIAGLTEHSKVRGVLDARERTMHCHHEKLVVVDGQVAFVGGIDLTALDGDRYDCPEHPPRDSICWHDAAAELRGPVVSDVASHISARWEAVTGERLAASRPPEPAGSTTMQFVRTVPENTYGFIPNGEFTIFDSYREALRGAQKLVYVESQFLWSTEIVNVLVALLRDPPSRDFRIVLVLPARPNNGADTTRGQLGRLLAADGGRRHLLATTLAAHDRTADGPLYVHAKIAIVDDNWLTIGSANLNDHSLFNDTEANVVTHDPELARATRLRLWAEHLRRPESDIAGDSTRVVDEVWRVIVEEQRRRQAAGLAPTHPLRLLAGVSKHRERLAGPLRGLLVDG